MSLSKVIEIARADLGYTENPPGSNRTKYWEAYDPKMQGQPWCVCFLWWVFQQAGERMAFFGGGKTASCGTLLQWRANYQFNSVYQFSGNTEVIKMLGDECRNGHYELRRENQEKLCFRSQ